MTQSHGRWASINNVNAVVVVPAVGRFVRGRIADTAAAAARVPSYPSSLPRDGDDGGGADDALLTPIPTPTSRPSWPMREGVIIRARQK